MTPRIALAGNPNSGKTTIFNALTGSNYKVANYPGVTVEKKEGRMFVKDYGETTLIDLPGIYSLFGHSPDEFIATKAILGQIESEQKPDLIISVVDASNLERNLFLTSQLMDLNVPLILAINMTDLAEKDGLIIRYEILSKELDLPVIPLAANTKKGFEQLKEEISKVCKKKNISAKTLAWKEGSEPALDADQENFGFEATARYKWINSVISKSCVYDKEETRKFNKKIDDFITHKIWGSLTFVLIMGFIFQSIFLWASYPMDLIDQTFVTLANWAAGFFNEGILKSLVVDGIISGVGSVVIFIPQIAVLFFFLGLLEDSGYLTRAAFLMDKIMRKVGLQGRSFIPLLSSFACAIPGIMSTRTIPSFADRMTTILVAPLMSCSARLPVYTLLIAAFVPNEYYFGFLSLQGIVLFCMYFLGVIAAAVVAWCLKLTLLRGEPAIFVMEMPRFRRPSLKTIFTDVIDRVMMFIKSAGTIILACSILLWFLASFPAGEVKDSYAGKIGVFMEPALKPLGFNWEIGVGILASFAAREVFISSLSTVYNLQDKGGQTESLIKVLSEKKSNGSFTTLTAISLMIFYVFACQCMSTLAVCKRETGSWWWTSFMFIYMTAMAYGASFLTFNIGRMIIN
jgi:ferrous iron transport protein B